ncbi:transposase [Bradyrhizobium sp. Pear77]|uniref:hypothetical protein n=1 Tax=Bradyrhizobium altum TaxID=1571202 RepID=UPI0035E2CC00|nr:transposase [Bradyrhizobium altum]
MLDLEGALVTADALHCRPDTAQAIRDRKGHYVLAIKSNRGRRAGTQLAKQHGLPAIAAVGRIDS